MAEREKFYITTAISYPNGPPHIGHAYEVIASDAIARFKRHRRLRRLLHHRHRRARPQDPADRRQERQDARKPSSTTWRRSSAPWPTRLNCSYDRFIRTTDADHLPSTQELWRRMQEQRRHLSVEIFRLVFGPRRGLLRRERTDEGAGRERGSLRPGTPVEWVEEESYFFRLSAYEDRLLEHYEAQPNFISPETRRNEIVSFVRAGLQDLSISRTTFDWGLPVAGRSEARHVCLGRRAQQLRHGLRLPRRAAIRAGTTGQPTCTSSARTSSASTRSIGRRS